MVGVIIVSLLARGNLGQPSTKAKDTRRIGESNGLIFTKMT
jgi:hypothetical protein